MSTRTFARNALALLAARGVTKAFSIAASIALVGYLGAARLGQYTGIMAATVIGEGIVALGLPVWLQRACARSPAEAPRLVRHALAIVTSTGLLCTGVLLIQAQMQGADRLTLASFGVAGLGLSLWAIASAYNAATQAAERMHLVAIIDIVSTVIRVGLIGAVIALHLGILELVAAYAVGHLVAAILASATSPARLGPWMLPGPLDMQVVREILRGTWPFALTSLAVGIYFRADVYVLQRWHGNEGVGLFDSAYRLASEGIAAGGILGGVFLPQLSSRWNRDPGGFARLLSEATRLCSVLGCGLALGIWLAAEPLAAAYASGYPGTAELLRALAPAIALSGAGAAAINAVLAAGRERTWLLTVASIALAKLAANLVLVPDRGPRAAAWVASAGEAALLGSLVLASWRHLASLAWLRGVAATFTAAALGLGVGLLFPQHAWTGTFLGLATYGVTLVVGGFFTAEDARRWREMWRASPAGAD